MVNRVPSLRSTMKGCAHAVFTRAIVDLCSLAPGRLLMMTQSAQKWKAALAMCAQGRRLSMIVGTYVSLARPRAAP
eukprot:23818-Eustigmatos_ZCMA.PRE.1